MAFNRFSKDARTVVGDATEIARDLGSTTLEAEHLLLALTRGATPVARVLADAGLDYDGMVAALAAETTRSLAAVGVSADALHFSPFVQQPRFATSAKLVLERALRTAVARGDRHIGSRHIALGALQAGTGTVPRALECADVDRAELTKQIQAL
jgi:ATP-dependent Clp protease ATP-binding subunit ClpA